VELLKCYLTQIIFRFFFYYYYSFSYVFLLILHGMGPRAIWDLQVDMEYSWQLVRSKLQERGTKPFEFTETAPPF